MQLDEKVIKKLEAIFIIYLKFEYGETRLKAVFFVALNSYPH